MTAIANPVARLVLHPFLFALYFVLTLAASNPNDLTGWSDLAWPILVSLLVCGFLCLMGFALTRAPQKAALLGFLWFVAFAVYGYVAETLRAAGTLGLIGGELGLGVLFLLALFGPSVAISRSARRLDPANRYLSLVALLLVAYTSVRLCRGLFRDQFASATLPLPAVSFDPATNRTRPDIYLIVLDKYTGGEVLEQHFGFDNSEFEAFLRSRGFVVPRSSQANYPLTLPALASMLNLDYLENLPRDLSLFDLIENNRLAAFLKAQGYRFIFFPTRYRLTFRSRAADVEVAAPKEVLTEFAAVWAATTMLPELLSGVCTLAGCDEGRFLARAQAADIMDWKFQRMKDLAGEGEGGPTFVLAHLLLPHEPYLYHADCSHRDPYWPVGFGLRRDAAANRGYLDQIRCANRKLTILVDSLLTRSSLPPVILLQADHGHGRSGKLRGLDKMSPYQVRERMSVFSAYLLPGAPGATVTDSVTPVNAVRLVLRRYFGAELPPLEDASYWWVEDQPHDVVRVR
jgi:hypothetical protein